MKLLVNFHPALTDETIQKISKLLADEGHEICQTSSIAPSVWFTPAPFGLQTAEKSALEQSWTTRLPGAELHLYARSHPFAVLGCGKDANEQFQFHLPAEDVLIHRLCRLLNQIPMSPLPFAGSLNQLETITTTPETTHAPGQKWSHLVSTKFMAEKQTRPANWRSATEEIPAVAHLISRSQASEFYISNGVSFILIGNPDLLRDSSRVLLITEDGGVIALHQLENNSQHLRSDSQLLSDQLLRLLNSSEESLFNHWKAQNSVTFTLNPEHNFRYVGCSQGQALLEHDEDTGPSLWQWNGIDQPSRLNDRAIALPTLMIAWQA